MALLSKRHRYGATIKPLNDVNRTSQTVNNTNTSTSFSYSNDDELTSTNGGFTNSYSYNANGEQTTRTLGGTSYTLAYDYEGQLTSISAGGVTQSSYTYDAMGRRLPARAAAIPTCSRQRAGTAATGTPG